MLIVATCVPDTKIGSTVTVLPRPDAGVRYNSFGLIVPASKAS